VATATLAKLAELLGSIGAPGSFTARRTVADAGDLDLEVRGLGRLRFPISRTRAQKLCKLAHPARFGQGERTLLDRSVRHTFEIPKSRIKIDKRRWNRTLLPVLDGLRADLGLPEGRRLRAELHSMLIYGPGQFFRRHRDSEKADDMVGTLVVTLPSAYKGGALTVEHRGEKVTYRASKRPLSFVAFYADCDHEAKPVTEGYRIVLTYNLMLAGDPGAPALAAETPPATVAALAARLREHFETPLPPLRWSPKDAPPREPPKRLVYLLDHQYTERGFGWERLKGDDAARGAALAAAAERAGCEMALALAEIHETWDCMEPEWQRPRYGRRRRWERGDDDWELPRDDPDAYELGERIDWGISLEHWIAPSGEKTGPAGGAVGDEEVCATTPTSKLEPYASEYEGYMGNWGNTMDRWYRRAAIVAWPRDRAFAVRAEAAPAWALQELERRLKAGERDEARRMAATLEPFWPKVAGGDSRTSFLGRALRVAERLEDPALATLLLTPLPVEALTPARAKELAAMAGRYGVRWTKALLAAWCDDQRRWVSGGDRGAWIAGLPPLVEALHAAGAGGEAAARLLLEVAAWPWLQREMRGIRGFQSPSHRERMMTARLPKPLAGYLESAAAAAAEDLRDQAVAFLCSADNDPLLPALVAMLRAAGRSPSAGAAPAFDAVAAHCAERLASRLARAERAPGNWSIQLPPGCRCELCAELDRFLADPGAEQLDWPLAKDKRSHVHGRIDAHELPVRHQTRRTGRPYVLVLTKTREIHRREAQERKAWRRDLDWLESRALRPARTAVRRS
jgi:hypothetical protein